MEVVRDFSRTIESFTTDLGTEMGIAKLRRDINLDEFVPGFTELFEDTKGAGHVDVEDTEGAGHADEECVIEFEPDDVADDEFPQLTGEIDDEAELEPPVAPVVGDYGDEAGLEPFAAGLAAEEPEPHPAGSDNTSIAELFSHPPCTSPESCTSYTTLSRM